MKSKDAEKFNNLYWDEVAPIHEKSYDIEGLKRKISQIER